MAFASAVRRLAVAVGVQARSFLAPVARARPAASLPSCPSSVVAPIRQGVWTRHAIQPSMPLPWLASRHFCAGTTIDSTAQPVGKPDEKVEVQPSNTESLKGSSKKHTFQAETRQLLNIVASSLYTDKEIFIRELISNASDALEKARYLQLTNSKLVDADLPLEIHIFTNEADNTLIIQDYGIGMSDEDFVSYLGTIAHSGTKNFVKKLQDGGDNSATATSNMIGQFGVGFYSVFMTANEVRVYSKPAKADEGEVKSHCWISDGSGQYDIVEADGVSRGTKIVINLKSEAKQFSVKSTVERIIKKYSNFVGFPILLNGEKVNTVSALWTLPRETVSTDQYREFYKFIANAYDDPLYTLHYATDVPVSIKALLYVPEQHLEKYGMGRQEPGVSLFSRKILIEPKSKLIMPEWLRFMKGVVDSEDIPLNISREHMQDSTLVARLSNVVVKKLLRFLYEEGKRDPVKYQKFFYEFSQFFKEGICSDFQFKDDISKLLRFDSSMADPNQGMLISFDEYISRMQPEQKGIYYLCVPNRAAGVNSPYYEAFREQNLEVLFLYQSIDDFVMTNLAEVQKRKLISCESKDVDIKATSKADDTMTEEQMHEMADWMKNTLRKQVNSVKITHRLKNSPAIVVDHESSSMRRMMRFVDSSRAPQLPKQALEINPQHPVIRKLFLMRNSKPEMATLVAEQIYDNALIAAGLMEDPRGMLGRLDALMEASLASSKGDDVVPDDASYHHLGPN
eukprot:gnl/Spiro4/29216_TR14287_c0_g1_i1.p1 gnl/Spiro4/29216_TR14287_c0_g1~~gnl/Spiro4/29216_TR14287_c0_g1_i1.p1  ORF type:complete len:739 (+),score=205.49 gnl/Spiro4/29216_TR14287_c0_g1_i1:105-2321(+)